MDRIVRRFFSEPEVPEAEIQFDHRPVLHAYAECKLQVDDVSGQLGRRNFHMTQGFTPIGPTRSTLSYVGTFLDGVNMDLLDQNNCYDLTKLLTLMKRDGAYKKDELEKKVELMWGHAWQENQVALIYNMMRYTFLRRVEETHGSLNGGFGDYKDGHVVIDMDQWFEGRRAFKPKASFNTWPCAPLDNAPPFRYERIDGFMPTDTYDAIDLTGLSLHQAQFVLLMLRQWNRRSRFRADHDCGQLTEGIFYRYHEDVPLQGYELFGETHLPPMLSSKEAWTAMGVYVRYNRLFGAFSCALRAFACMPYQFMPSTAEATMWAEVEWTVNLPAFHSSRGWVAANNEGVPAIVDKVSLAEWEYFSPKFETVNLLALVWIQAVQTGMAVRSIRRGLEFDPTDLLGTQTPLGNAETRLCAYAAEALRISVPGTGYPEVYVEADINPEIIEANRVIPTVRPWEDGIEIEGYDVAPVTVRGRTAEYKNVHIGTVTEEEDPEYKIRDNFEFNLEMATFKKGVAERNRTRGHGSTDPNLSQAERLALDHLVRIKRTEVSAVKVVGIRAPRVVFAGIPVYIMPLKCFPYSTPLELCGVITPSADEYYPAGAWVNPVKAWHIGQVSRLCGYDVGVKVIDPNNKITKFYSPNFVNFVWPVLQDIDGPDAQIKLTNQVPRPPRPFIQLPYMYNIVYRTHEVRYKIDIISRGTARGHDLGRKPISYDVLEEQNAVVTYEVRFSNSAMLKATAAWVTRERSDFRFALVAKDGAELGLPRVPDAAGAIDPCNPPRFNQLVTLEEIELDSLMSQLSLGTAETSSEPSSQPTLPAAIGTTHTAPGPSEPAASTTPPPVVEPAGREIVNYGDVVYPGMAARYTMTELFRTTSDYGLKNSAPSVLPDPPRWLTRRHYAGSGTARSAGTQSGRAAASSSASTSGRRGSMEAPSMQRMSP
jgi:hypothetical protein